MLYLQDSNSSSKKPIQFNPDWLNENKHPKFAKWLTLKLNPQTGENQAFCRDCPLFYNNHKGDLVKHVDRTQHKRNMEKLPELLKQQDRLPNFASPLRDRTTNLELRILAHICENSQSVCSAQGMLEVMQTEGNDPIFKKATLGNTKACNLIREYWQNTLYVICITMKTN